MIWVADFKELIIKTQDFYNGFLTTKKVLTILNSYGVVGSETCKVYGLLHPILKRIV